MIPELLDATEAALSERCGDGFCRSAAFIEEWVPKIITRMEELEKQLSDVKMLQAMTESQLLEAEDKLKEIEDV